MKIVVTGGAGFIGSNYILYALRQHANLDIVNFDALTYAGNLENLSSVEQDSRYTFIKGDIGNKNDVEALFEAYRFDAVLNIAAETHVDRSLHHDVSTFIQTNVLGTQLLLDATRKYKVPRYLQVSTDEVYGSLGPRGAFRETSPVQPNNPYAATKAAADFLVRAAQRSYGIDAVITRCSNNYGPYQFPEKLIPLMISRALENKDLPIYGDGMHVRDWIHVDDHNAAMDLVLHKGKSGELYHIGSMNDVPNLHVVKTLLSHLGKPETLIKFVADRPGHDRRYAMDATKIRNALGWEPAYTFADGLKKTIDWYLANREWLDHIRTRTEGTHQ